MNVIVCADDCYGMAFNKRRQSRDRKLIDDMLAFLNGQILWIHQSAVKLFPPDLQNMKIYENLHQVAPLSDWCFVETEELSSYAEQIQTILLYRWNRQYPSDLKLPEFLLTDRKCVEAVSFPGESHERISREEFIR